MLFLYIFIAILLIILFAIIVPIKIEIKDKFVPNSNVMKKYKSESVKQENYIKLKIFWIIPVFKIDLEKSKKKSDENKLYKNKTNDPLEMVINTVFNLLDKAITSEKINKVLLTKKDIKKIIKSISFKKLDLDIGINFLNDILNAYVVTIINVVINMFIVKNIKKFNLNDTRYKTYISGEVYNLKIDSIFNVKIANIICIIIKIIFKLRKVDKKNGRHTTSNRKFNDDSYDISREYGRC